MKYAVTGKEINGVSYPAYRNEDLAGCKYIKAELISNSIFSDYDEYGKPKDYTSRKYMFTYDMKMKSEEVKRATIEVNGLDNDFWIDGIKY